MLVWTIPNRIGGLGDLLRGIRFSFLLAIFTRRLFFIDWPTNPVHPFPLTAALLPNLVDWRLLTPVTASVESLSQNVYNYSMNISYDGNSMTIFQIRPGKRPVLHTQIPLVESNSTVELFQGQPLITVSNILSKRVFHQFAKLLVRVNDSPPLDPNSADRLLTSTLFHPSAAVSQLVKERTRFSENASFVGVHVRLGTDVDEEHLKRFSIASANDYAAARQVLECVRQVDTANTRHVYLASDSLPFKVAFEKMGENMGINVQTVQRKARHIGSEFEERQVSLDERCNGFLDAFADVYALARAYTLLQTGSSFAYTAYCLGNGVNVTVIHLRRKHPECVLLSK